MPAGDAGESLSGVYSANELLTRVNLMGAWRFPECDTPVKIGRRVAVIGGGNTAMDAVRTARRLGAEKAYLIYRRSREEMPARVEEVHHAEEQGIELVLLTAPLRILGDAQGWVTGLECQRMELGEPDESRRRRPVPVRGSEYVLAVQTVIEAIGQRPNPIVQATTPGLATGERGTVRVGEAQQTNRPGVFAGGDVARGGATVILANAGRPPCRGRDPRIPEHRPDKRRAGGDGRSGGLHVGALGDPEPDQRRADRARPSDRPMLLASENQRLPPLGCNSRAGAPVGPAFFALRDPCVRCG